MKISSEIMKQAHKMTKEIRKEYDVNYSFQLGICIKMLLSDRKDMEVSELKGSEKQVAWAKEIRTNMIADIIRLSAKLEGNNSNFAVKALRGYKGLTDYIEKETSSAWFINNRYNDVQELGRKFR